jgi:hypothetical protein
MVSRRPEACRFDISVAHAKECSNEAGGAEQHHRVRVFMTADMALTASAGRHLGASFATSPKFGDFRMAHAQCMCGALRLTLPVSEAARLVVVCHCLDCQRRSGGPFGLGAFYPAEFATISGDHRKFTRSAASGGKVHNFFCPNCGSTVFWKADNLPGFIGVAVGALADPQYPAPSRSVFEQSKHHWVQIDGVAEHFQQSSATKNAE